MTDGDVRADKWRAAVAAALDTSPLSQAELARIIGRHAQQVSDWIAGRAAPPRPDVVFAIEDALGVPDQLASVLGYVRAGGNDTESALAQDPALDEVDRATLLRMYRLMAGR